MNRFATTFTTDPDHYMDGNINNRTAKNVLDDNFDTIRGNLHQPTPDADVQTAVNGKKNIDVILWRGVFGSKMTRIESANSAGGDPVNASVAPPAAAIAQKQVGFGRTDGYTEFSSSTDLGFSFQHWVAVVKINTKYLTRGSATEEGWVCANTAPVELLDVVNRTLGFTETMGANAS